jgi:hypothetical protein
MTAWLKVLVQGFQISLLIFSIKNTDLFRVIWTTFSLSFDLHKKICSINTQKLIPVWALLYSVTFKRQLFMKSQLFSLQQIFKNSGSGVAEKCTVLPLLAWGVDGFVWCFRWPQFKRSRPFSFYWTELYLKRLHYHCIGEVIYLASM